MSKPKWKKLLTADGVEMIQLTGLAWLLLFALFVVFRLW
jgi:hypothetical protein